MDIAILGLVYLSILKYSKNCRPYGPHEQLSLNVACAKYTEKAA